jgi:hypothetical protein
MASFRVQFVLKPTAPFGVPDGDVLVLPARAQTIEGPAIHMKSGVVSSHGTLSVFRDKDQALKTKASRASTTLEMLDNYGTLTLESSSVEAGLREAQQLVEFLCDSLSIHTGQRFSGIVQFIEDEQGQAYTPRGPTVLPLSTTTQYDVAQLDTQMRASFEWASLGDERLEKTFLYAEHSFLLNEFAQQQGYLDKQAGFSRGLAFLQLFKALAVLLGEKGQDSDYQRRFRELGLPSGFWNERVEPLYKIRNDEDVAHYRLSPLEPTAFMGEFRRALAVLKEVIEAHVETANGGRRDA